MKKLAQLRKKLTVIRTAAKKPRKRLVEKIKHNPVKSFLVLLALLLLFIVTGSIVRKPKTELKSITQPKMVATYTIGSVPKVSVQAQIKKSGVVTVSAQTAGIVQHIYPSEGAKVAKGASLVSLSTNYQGGNAPSLQRQLAQKQYQQIADTYDTQKELIGKQKEIAQKTDDNSNELRDISRQSIDETNSLLSLNQDILATLDANLSAYEATNSAGLNNALILSTKQLKNQYLSAVNQLKNQLRSTQYQTDGDKPPTHLSSLQKDIVIKQLEIQEKSLDISREIAQIQLSLARVNEANMFPSSPFGAKVERVFVRVGQSVTPGTPLVSLGGNAQEITAVALVPEQIAAAISRMEPSIVSIGGKTASLYPSFISTEGTHGQLFSVIYTIPKEVYDPEPDGAYIRIDIPVGYPNTTASVPFVPIDSVFETQSGAFIYTLVGAKAQSKPVELGQVMGRFVQVKQGLANGDQVILDRSVISGEDVIPQT